MSFAIYQTYVEYVFRESTLGTWSGLLNFNLFISLLLRALTLEFLRLGFESIIFTSSVTFSRYSPGD